MLTIIPITVIVIKISSSRLKCNYISKFQIKIFLVKLMKKEF